MSVGVALARTLFARHRVGLTVCACYLLAYTAAQAFFKDHLGNIAPALMFIVLMVISFYVLAVFIHSDSDVGTPGSTYPVHYFHLPVQTRDLVIWPLLFGTGCCALLGVAIAYSTRTLGANFSLLDAVLVMVAILTTLQAIFWYPFGIPYAKLLLTLFGLSAVTILAFSTSLFSFTPIQKAIAFSLLIALSVFAIGRGVRRARIGEVWSSGSSLSRKSEVTKTMREEKPFKNAAQAQFWYEWRQQGRTLPILSTLLFLIFLIPYYWNNTLTPIQSLQDPATGIMPTVPTFLWSYYPLVIGLMGIYSWMIGCGARKTDVKRGDKTFHLFFGTRPMTDEALVWSKLKVAAASSLAAWGLLAALSIPILFANGGRATNMELVGLPAPMYAILPSFITPQAGFRILCVILIAVFFTWRNYVIGFWTELSGNLLYRYAQPLLSVFAIVGLIVWSNMYRPVSLNWVPYALGILLAFKVIVAVMVSYHLLKTQAIAVCSLMKLSLGYAVGVALLGGLSVYAIGTKFAEYENVPALINILPITFTFALLLYVPFTRILLAIATLSQNRHRV